MAALELTDPVALSQLNWPETRQLEEVARKLCAVGDGWVDDPDWIEAARHAWEDAPASLRRAVRDFRRNSGHQGVLLIRGLPVDDNELPRTPHVDNSVQRVASKSAAILLMVASGLGDPAAYKPEKFGALVQDVVPVPGKEMVQSNAGSSMLKFHVENAFHPHRPDYVLLNCLRPDRERAAGLLTACVRSLFAELSDDSVHALRAEEFITAPPPSFGAVAGSDVPHAVLDGCEDEPEIRLDFAATHALTERGAAALADFRDLCESRAVSTYLNAGDLAVVDNRTTLHGRTAFHARYDGKDRWLQRTFVLADLRRSRAYRPGDGHVLTR